MMRVSSDNLPAACPLDLKDLSIILISDGAPPIFVQQVATFAKVFLDGATNHLCVNFHVNASGCEYDRDHFLHPNDDALFPMLRTAVIL